jgi:hypothetical protein
LAAFGHGKNRFQLQIPGQLPGGPKAISYQLEVYFYPRLDRPDIKVTPAQIIARAKKYRTGGPEIDYQKVVFGTDEELNGELDKVAPRQAQMTFGF